MDLMNTDVSALLSALQSGYQTVKVQFLNDRLADGNEQPSGKLYTYKVPSAWQVQKGDWLIVLPISSYKTVVVQDVDTTPNTYDKLKWAVQKIDGNFYFQMKMEEEKLSNALAFLKRKRELEALMAELQSTIGDVGIVDLQSGFQRLLGVQPQQQQPVQPVSQVAQQQPAVQTAAVPTPTVAPQQFGQATSTINAEAMAQAAGVHQGNAQGVAANTLQATPTAAGGDATAIKPSWAQ
jgi:hypothetical protein